MVKNSVETLRKYDDLERYLIIGAVIAVTSSIHPAFTASGAANHSTCTGVSTNLSQMSKQQYATLIAAAIGQNVKPSQVTIEILLTSGTWSMAHADTPVADPGYFFFQSVSGHEQFADVWGGAAQPSELPEVIAWAKKLGAPNNLATCFAQLATAADEHLKSPFQP